MSLQSTFQIGSVLRDAIVFDFKNSPSDRMKADSLLTSVDRLFAILEERKIDYVMVGGVALLTYVEGRNTQDIDLIMSLSSLAKMPEIEILNQDNFFVRGRFGELQIDVLLTRNPLFEKVLRRYSTKKQFMERKIHCATVEGLLILKIYALPSLYRQGNFIQVGLYENDISSLLYKYQPSLKILFKDLEKHLGETDIQEVHKIVEEIQGRIKRFRKSSVKSLPDR